MALRATSLLVAGLVLVCLICGCGRKDQEDDRSPSAAPPTKVTRPPDPASRDEPRKPKGLEPPGWTAIGEWAAVGDVALKIQGVRLQKPVMIGGLRSDREYELDEPELLMHIQVENRSKVRKFDYSHSSFTAGFTSSVKLADEHGNKYRARNHSGPSSSLKGSARFKAIHPGDPPVDDILAFERPVAAATRLQLVMPALDSKAKGEYRFEIPSAAWKP